MGQHRERSHQRGERIPGTQYECVDLIGRGGHGEVYVAVHTFLGTRVAVKTLHAGSRHPDLAVRMEREARTMAQLRHPNIVEVVDGGLTADDPPRPYLVMEFLNGENLRSVLEELRDEARRRGEPSRGVGIQATLNISVSVLDAIEYAHGRGVVHRDLKAENIFLCNSRGGVTTAKVLDFGVAHLMAVRRITGEMFIGTPRTAAPEQIKGASPTPQMDLYAIGILMFEMLSGSHPFPRAKTFGELARAHIEDAPPPLPDDIDERLRRLVTMCLAKDPAKRPASAGWLAIELRKVKLALEEEYGVSVVDPRFKTEETPIENLMKLIGNDSSGGAPILAEAPGASAAATARAIPAKRAGDATSLDGSTERDVRPLHNGTHNQTARLGSPSFVAGPTPAPLHRAFDRAAPTPTLTPRPATRRSGASDTEELPYVSGDVEPNERAYVSLDEFLRGRLRDPSLAVDERARLERELREIEQPSRVALLAAGHRVQPTEPPASTTSASSLARSVSRPAHRRSSRAVAIAVASGVVALAMVIFIGRQVATRSHAFLASASPVASATAVPQPVSTSTPAPSVAEQPVGEPAADAAAPPALAASADLPSTSATATTPSPRAPAPSRAIPGPRIAPVPTSAPPAPGPDDLKQDFSPAAGF